MNAQANEVRFAGLGMERERETAGESLRNAQFALLSELPGVVFGLLTLTWIVTSLIALS